MTTTLQKLKSRAKKFGMMIRKYERGEDSFMLVDIVTNAAVAPAPMTLAELSLWLGDLEARKDLEETDVPF